MAISVTSFGSPNKNWRKDGSVTTMFTNDTLNLTRMLFGHYFMEQGQNSPHNYFNMTTRISDFTTGCADMFRFCTSMNSEVVFGNNVTTCINMFYECRSFNQPIHMPASTSMIANMFYNCHQFNSPVVIDGDGNLGSMAQMFYDCYKFNQPVNFGHRTHNAYMAFWNCINFNQPIEFGDSSDIQQALYYCNNFCSSVTIHDNCYSSGYTQNAMVFYGNTAHKIYFESPIKIGHDVRSTPNMFMGNYDVRGNVTIGSNSYVAGLFSNAGDSSRWINSDIIYVGAACQMSGMFTDYGYNVSNLFIEYSNVRKPSSLFNGQHKYAYTNSQIKHSIYYNDADYLKAQVFNNVAFQTISGGYYNAAYNLYLYNGTWPINIHQIDSNATNLNYRFQYQTNWSGGSGTMVIPSGVKDAYHMFYCCNSFNQGVDFSQASMVNLKEAFYNCYNLNMPITMPQYAIDCNYMFSGCNKFNRPIIIPDGTKGCYYMFNNCQNFNSSITFANGGKNAGSIYITNMLIRCFNFNKPFTIPKSVDGGSKDARGSSAYIMALFGTIFNSTLTIQSNSICIPMLGMNININDPNSYSSYNYNNNVKTQITSYNPLYEIKIGELCESMSNMFAGISIFTGSSQVVNYSQFNGYVNMDGAANLKYTDNMFNNCYNFNRPVNIPNNILDSSNMFLNCTKLNQPITFGNNYGDCSNMFWNCTSYNQPIVLGNNYNDCRRMFNHCTTFNSTITFGYNLTNCLLMFDGCSAFNQPVNIKEGAKDLSYMFNYCTSLNRDIIIPASANNLYRMLNYCQRFSANIYVKNDNLTQSNISAMLNGTNNSIAKNIYCNNLAIFNATSGYTVTGATMTWVPMTNGYYSAATNIFLYNNMPAGI